MTDISTFDKLPNEIFHELFLYFNIRELYETFSRINIRFDLLIKNYNYLQVTANSINEMNHPVHRYYLPFIRRLIINHSKVFFDSDEHILTSVQCLILLQPSRDQWEAIQPIYFPSLQRLFLNNSTFIYKTKQLCQLIFSNQFSNLYQCEIPFVGYELNNQWHFSPKLRSIEIKIWDIRIYEQILRCCSNLIRFKIELSGPNEQTNLTSNVQHFRLEYLKFRTLHSITYEQIDSIVSLVPNLRHFILQATHYKQTSISLEQLNRILKQRTHSLIHFNFNIRFYL